MGHDQTHSAAPGHATHTTENAERVRVLVLATVGFTVFFAVWVMFAIVGIPIRKEFGLERRAVRAARRDPDPDRLDPPRAVRAPHRSRRWAGASSPALLVATAVPTYLVSRASGYTQLVVLAFFVGLAGVSFAVGIAWVSAWYPPERQGFALGVFGAGNVGASITKLAGAHARHARRGRRARRRASIPGGWRFVPFVYAILLLAMARRGLARRRPGLTTARRAVARSARSTGRCGDLRVWRFGLYYIVVFGAYVGLALWLPKYYVDVYDVDLQHGRVPDGALHLPGEPACGPSAATSPTGWAPDP